MQRDDDDLLASVTLVIGELEGEFADGARATPARLIDDPPGERRKFRFGGGRWCRGNQQENQERARRSNDAARRCAAKAHQNLTWGTCWLCSGMVNVSRTFMSGYRIDAIQRCGIVLNVVLYSCPARM